MAAVAAAAAASTKKVDGVLPALRVPSTDAKFGGGGGFVEPFLERMQELTALGSQIGSTGIITEAEQRKFELELRNYHRIAATEVAAYLCTSPDRGLSAVMVVQRIAQYGHNVLKPPFRIPVWVRFVLCFFSGFQPLLWIATIFVFLSWQPFGTPPSNVYNLVLAVTLLVIITLSALFTFYQEWSSAKVLEGFKDLLPSSAIVIRDGMPSRQLASDITVGDVVKLEAGTRVPADMRVLSSAGLRIDKSMLTGESEPVRITSEPAGSKSVMLGAPNMAFMGCSITEGSGLGVVIAVGNENQIGKIAGQVSKSSRLTPLQRELNRFVVIIASFAFIVGVVVISVWAGYLRVQHPTFMNTATMIANAISVIVAFVPEGLPLALTVGLTIIARRLCSQHFVLVKQLSTVEALGSVTLIASDKTGTLTQNMMSVVGLIMGSNAHHLTPADWTAAALGAPFHAALRTAVLCNAASFQAPSSGRSNESDAAASTDMGGDNDERIVVGGNGIDKACLLWADAYGASSMRVTYKSRAVLPFSSATKLSAGVWRTTHGDKTYVLVKGAPEYVLSRCTTVYSERAESPPIPLTDAARDAITAAVEGVSCMGQRVVALAELTLSNTAFPPSFEFTVDPEPNFPLTGLTFIACVAVSDPPRAGVAAAVASLRDAGIKIAMVTGDAASTAAAIALEVGIISDRGTAPDTLKAAGLLPKTVKVTGAAAASPTVQMGIAELAAGGEGGKPVEHTVITANPAVGQLTLVKSREATKQAFATRDVHPACTSKAIIVSGPEMYALNRAAWDYIFAHDELVFARTTPEQKLQIVRESRDRGHRVGVTGDGVNDAPALKAADVGIAMASGSEVARGAANIVLLKDDFAAIPHGVSEGRVIHTNLRKVIAYQIAAGCYSELLPVLATFFLGVPQPLSSFLMIIISCLTDVGAGIALMYEPAQGAIMKQPPRNVKEHLVTPMLIAYGYMFAGNIASVASFVTWFVYMFHRGPPLMPSPLPADDDTVIVNNPLATFPAGYTAEQLMAAWNWLTSSSSGNLYTDENAAATVASSVFYTVLSVTQMAHLLSIRRTNPYFCECFAQGMTAGERWRAFLAAWRPRPTIILSWCWSILVINALNEGPALQSLCGTGSVPPLYWGMAIGWAGLLFVLMEARKWVLYLNQAPERKWVRRLAFEFL